MSPPVLWDGKESACNSRDPVLIPGSGRSPGEGHDNWLQYSCLENPMDRVVWWAAAHGVPKSQTGLSDWAHTHTAPPGMAESLHCSPETIKALLIGYTPIQNKKFLKRHIHTSVQFSSVQLLSCVWLFVIPAHQASLSITNSQSFLKLMSIKLVMPSNHLILCHPLLLPPSIFPSIRVFSNESHQVAKVLEFQLQHQSFQWLFRTDFL